MTRASVIALVWGNDECRQIGDTARVTVTNTLVSRGDAGRTKPAVAVTPIASMLSVLSSLLALSQHTRARRSSFPTCRATRIRQLRPRLTRAAGTPSRSRSVASRSPAMSGCC